MEATRGDDRSWTDSPTDGRGQLHGKDKIGVPLNKYKVGKHFTLDIRDNSFSFEIDETAEALTASIVILAEWMKTDLSAQLQVADPGREGVSFLQEHRPEGAAHSSPARKPSPGAHLRCVLLSYYVLWHMMEAWRPLLFADEDQQAKAKRDPVAPAKRSEAAMRKIQTKKLDDGSPASSFRTLLRLLSNIVRNKCRRSSDMTFDVTTSPDSKQRRAYELLKGITV